MKKSLRSEPPRLTAWLWASGAFGALAAMFLHCQFRQCWVFDFGGFRRYGWPFVLLDTIYAGSASVIFASVEFDWHPRAMLANAVVALILSVCASIVVFRIARRITWPPKYRLFSLAEAVLATTIVLAAIRLQPDLKTLARSVGLEPGYPLYIGLYQTVTLFACGATAYVFARLVLTAGRQSIAALRPKPARNPDDERARNV